MPDHNSRTTVDAGTNDKTRFSHSGLLTSTLKEFVDGYSVQWKFQRFVFAVTIVCTMEFLIFIRFFGQTYLYQPTLAGYDVSISFSTAVLGLFVAVYHLTFFTVNERYRSAPKLGRNKKKNELIL